MECLRASRSIVCAAYLSALYGQEHFSKLGFVQTQPLSELGREILEDLLVDAGPEHVHLLLPSAQTGLLLDGVTVYDTQELDLSFTPGDWEELAACLIQLKLSEDPDFEKKARKVYRED